MSSYKKPTANEPPIPMQELAGFIINQRHKNENEDKVDEKAWEFAKKQVEEMKTDQLENLHRELEYWIHKDYRSSMKDRGENGDFPSVLDACSILMQTVTQALESITVKNRPHN